MRRIEPLLRKRRQPRMLCIADFWEENNPLFLPAVCPPFSKNWKESRILRCVGRKKKNIRVATLEAIVQLFMMSQLLLLLLTTHRL